MEEMTDSQGTENPTSVPKKAWKEDKAHNGVFPLEEQVG